MEITSESPIASHIMDEKTTEEARLALRLSKLDPEKFLTLCRMHLSFILDLDSEQIERIGNSYLQVKDKTRKPVISQRKCKLFGAKGDEDCTISQTKDGKAVYELINFLGLDQNITQEGLFRKSGKVSRQEELLKLIKSGQSLQLENGNYSAHDCASVLKKCLSELPEPLLTDQHYNVHCQIANLSKPSEDTKAILTVNRQIEALQLIIWLLPNKNRKLLKHLLYLLHQVAKREVGNKMSATNLATLFAPHILCPRKMSAIEFCNNSTNMIKAVECMINYAPELFKLPEILARDLQVLWNSKLECNLKANQSCDSDDSKSIDIDDEAVTTVTTFCERQSVNQENNDTTALALAQLYAHVQALPESSKKKHLIKQFNKENGTGTPLCSEQSRNHQRSKSLKKTFKKRLFGRHKRHRSSELLTDDRCLTFENNGSISSDTATSDCWLRKVKSYDFYQESSSPTTSNGRKDTVKLLTKSTAV